MASGPARAGQGLLCGCHHHLGVQVQFPNHLLEEGRPAGARLDQAPASIGSRDRQRDAGEAGAAADVYARARRHLVHQGSQAQRIVEMAFSEAIHVSRGDEIQSGSVGPEEGLEPLESLFVNRETPF
jgi:hypothetical protein